MSVPSFWIGAMVVLYPSIWWAGRRQWSILLQQGPDREPVDDEFIPAMVLGSMGTGGTVRMMRTLMLETLRQDTSGLPGLKVSPKGSSSQTCDEECDDTDRDNVRRRYPRPAGRLRDHGADI